jgi:hypothetical protein
MQHPLMKTRLLNLQQRLFSLARKVLGAIPAVRWLDCGLKQYGTKRRIKLTLRLHHIFNTEQINLGLCLIREETQYKITIGY